MTTPFIDLLARDETLPDGCDHWAFRAVHADLTSRNGFQYPISGRVEAPGPILPHDGECPQAEGDGLCVAHSIAGARSGGIPLHSILLVAYSTTDVLGSSSSKSRVRGMTVVRLIDAWRVLRDWGAGAYLYGANLSGANLHGADLNGANLYGANLNGAYLYGADLSGANLHGAYLYGAYLYGADLSGADLYGADLSGAYLYGADLSGADLYGADLSGANLYGAIGANTEGAIL